MTCSATTSRSEDDSIVLRAVSISKAFGVARKGPSAFARKLLLWSGEENEASEANTVLDGFSCEIRAGELLLVHGRNGIGKTVMAGCLSGLLPFDAGRIEFPGVGYGGTPPTARQSRYTRQVAIRHRVDYVPQFPPRPAGVTGIELLALGDEPGGWLFDRRRLTRHANEIAGRIGVTLDPGRPLRSYSMPQLQTLYIVRAALQRSRLLILDEPTAMLGPEEAQRIGGLIENLRGSGTAVMVIAHPSQGVTEMGLEEAEGARVVQFTGSGLKDNQPAPLPLDLTNPTERVVEPSASWSQRTVRVGETNVTLRPSEVTAIVGPPTDAFALAAYEVADQLIEAPCSDDAPQSELKTELIPFQAREHWLVRELSLLDNSLLGHLGDRGSEVEWKTPFGRISRTAATLQLLKPIVESLGVRPKAPHRRLEELSGGNRQRFLVGRSLHRPLDILIGCDLDYGLDAEGIQAIGRLIESRAARGLAILLFSTTRELPTALASAVHEVDAHCRIVTLHEHDE